DVLEDGGLVARSPADPHGREVELALRGVRGCAIDDDEGCALVDLAEGVLDRPRGHDCVGHRDLGQHDRGDQSGHGRDEDGYPAASDPLTLGGPPHGRPTHSSVPSAKFWYFQIGTLLLRSSIKARAAAKASARWAAAAARTTARSPTL